MPDRQELTIREQLEARETQYLSQYAKLSRDSAGRKREERQCDLRPVFQRDRDRILHCKSFRRLKQKTQVFLLPKGDHYRTRLTHTLEVSQNARTIAKALRLNEDLTEAIALGMIWGILHSGMQESVRLIRSVRQDFSIIFKASAWLSIWKKTEED